MPTNVPKRPLHAFAVVNGRPAGELTTATVGLLRTLLGEDVPVDPVTGYAIPIWDKLDDVVTRLERLESARWVFEAPAPEAPATATQPVTVPFGFAEQFDRFEATAYVRPDGAHVIEVLRVDVDDRRVLLARAETTPTRAPTADLRRGPSTLVTERASYAGDDDRRLSAAINAACWALYHDDGRPLTDLGGLKAAVIHVTDDELERARAVATRVLAHLDALN